MERAVRESESVSERKGDARRKQGMNLEGAMTQRRDERAGEIERVWGCKQLCYGKYIRTLTQAVSTLPAENE